MSKTGTSLAGSQVASQLRTAPCISGLYQTGGWALQTGRISEEPHSAEKGSGLRESHPVPARLSTRNCPSRPVRQFPAAPPRPGHVRVLGAGYDVRLELGVVEGRGGADQPRYFLPRV